MIELIIISSIGAMFECYDFMICIFLYTFITQMFFGNNTFFSVFAIFTVGFLSRPLGGIFWAHFGDRYGRRKIFSLTMALLSLPTLLIAVFPVDINLYLNLIGFMILRFFQGFLVGGEFAGGVTYIAEIVGAKFRGSMVAIFITLLSCGTMLASLVCYLLITNLTNAQMLHYGWRIPFFIGLILVVIAIYLRRHAFETPYYTSYRLHAVKIPLISLFVKHTFALIIGLITAIFSAFGITTLYSFLPLLLKSTFSTEQILFITTIGTLTLCIFMPIAGLISDIIGRKIVLITGLLATNASMYLLHIQLISLNYRSFFFVFIINSIAFAGINALYCNILCELFPSKVRYTGVAFCFMLAYSLCGGLLPIIYIKFAAISNTFVLPTIICVSISIATIVTAKYIPNLQNRELPT